MNAILALLAIGTIAGALAWVVGWLEERAGGPPPRPPAKPRRRQALHWP